MKVNFIIPVLSAIILGYLCANYVISEYTISKTTNSKIVYFLELKDENNDTTNLKNKITVEEDKKYIYIGMTLDNKEANRIKDIYNKANIKIDIRKKNIDNNNFLLELEQYDILLKNSNNKEEIDHILETILSSFEENFNNS